MDIYPQTLNYEDMIIKYFRRPDIFLNIKQIFKLKTNQLVLCLDSLRDYNEDLARMVLKEPLILIPILNNQLNKLITAKIDNKEPISQMTKDKKVIEYTVTFKGTFGKNMVSPRDLTDDFLNSMVCVKGVVSRSSVVKSAKKSVRTNKKIKTNNEIHYKDAIYSNIFDTENDIYFPFYQNTSNILNKNKAKAKTLSFEYGLSNFSELQRLILQEPPERTPVGQLPRSVEVVLQDDLVDRVKPGDRVQIVGVFKCVSTQLGDKRTFLQAYNINYVNDLEVPEFTSDDLREFKELSSRTDVFEVLANSFCPYINGHPYIKKALIMQLLGGVEKNLENGTHLRGDINILLIGDPSSPKSEVIIVLK